MTLQSVLRDALGVEGGRITGVISRDRDRVVLGVAILAGRAQRCNVCGAKSPLYDRGCGVRSWRAVDLGVIRVELKGERRRVRCRRHGVVSEAVPWARSHSEFTRDFEDMVAWLVTQASRSAVSELMRVAWRTTGTIVERVVAEAALTAPVAPLRSIGIDEKSYRRGHRYITLVVDHDQSRLVWAHEGKSAAVLNTFFDEIGPERAAAIQTVSSDAAPWIEQVLEARIPQAQRCLDPFHVVAWATDAVERHRREEANMAHMWMTRGAARYIKGSRWILRTGAEHLSDRQRRQLDDLAERNEPLYRCYLLKEQLRLVFRVGGDEGCDLLREWLDSALTCGLSHIEVVAERISDHLDAACAAIRLRISNARTEAFNTRIQMLNRRAYGFHSALALIALARLCMGGLCPPLPGRA